MPSPKTIKLSASSADRWYNCTPSAKLEAEYGVRTESPYMREGSLAHEYAEYHARQAFGFDPCNITPHKAVLDEGFDPEEMRLCAYDYAEYLKTNSTEGAHRDFEQFVTCPDYLAGYEGRHKIDYYEVCNDHIFIVDYKYGKGVLVDAEENIQMRIYALAVYLENQFCFDFPPSTTVTTVIYQPRAGAIKREDITLKDLLKWAVSLKKRATLALKGKGEYCAGAHCRFCSVKEQCKARAEQNLQIEQYGQSPPELLTMEDITDILRRTATLKSWITDVESFAQTEALRGTKFEGFKLVEGRANRKWINEEEVAARLVFCGYSDDEIYQKKLIGITQGEKLVGKKDFGTVFEGLVVRPKGAPSLVPDTDPREEYKISSKDDFEVEK